MNRSLFPDSEDEVSESAPLAERMRPRSLDQVRGQDHLLADGKVLRDMIRRDRLSSIIFWGPPGSGKTTLARIVARETRSTFVSYSAVLSGIREIKNVMSDAERQYRVSKRPTIVFVDEIHRFNKAQQDAFLPYVESGVIVLIGATTENPSFEVIGALLSRMKVYVLNALSPRDLQAILERALEDGERGLGRVAITASAELLSQIALSSDGDARKALNTLEIAVGLARSRSGEGAAVLEAGDILAALQQKTLRYDKAGEEHYNLISALHKSLRNSDPDAALYWLGRMLESGEDPVYIARRLVRFASEDVGMADVRALSVALDATDAVRLVGLPECVLALAQAAVYLAVAPKSNSLYRAYGRVVSTIEESSNEPPPLEIRNAPTQLMKDLGYGRGYQYAHDTEEKVADMECLPASLRGRRFYEPSNQGMERRIREALEDIRERRRKAGRKPQG